MLESQLEVVKSKDWDELLANDDLSKYDEIQKILGSSLDNHSTNSVESQAIDQPAAEKSQESQAPKQDQKAAAKPAAKMMARRSLSFLTVRHTS